MFFVSPSTYRVVYRVLGTNDDNIMDGHDPLSFDTYQTRYFIYTENGLSFQASNFLIS